MNPILPVVTVTFLVAIAAASRDCTIMNLPPIAYKRGDQHINFIEYPQNTTVSITLECRCFVYRPTWNHYKMTTMEETSPSGSSVQCKKNGKSCSTSIIFPFNQDPPNHYVYQTTTFVITEPSILMCSSWREKEMVIISLKQPDPVEPCPTAAAEIPPSSSLAMAVSPSPVFSPTNAGSQQDDDDRTLTVDVTD